ncbi:MAG: DUF1565 domain-containing protein, partial [Candidatus Marinimicrobia bacterium]|nr:DUF1565 domain-containing protein [Candidatus Neomarinimicrobiota bacterium]
SDLSINTAYYVNISSAAFEDTSGNDFAGISNTTTWNFHTLEWETFGPTEVSGVISSNTTWSLLSSPYIATGNILVSEGVTLTIEPGVTVQLNNNAYILVQGELIAEGTSSNNITFDPFGKGIHFGVTATDYDSLSNTGCRISYANISNPTSGNFDPVISGGRSSTHLVTGEYSSSSSNQQVSISISNCLIEDTYMVFTGWGGKEISEKSFFTNNVFINGSLEGDNAPNFLVKNNYFINSSFGTSSFDFKNNILDGCSISRFYSQLHGYGYHSQSYVFSNNYINTRITKFQGGESIDFENNTYYCESGDNVTGTVSYFTGNNITGGTGYKYVMESSNDLNAENNYWGTTSLDSVQGSIYDYNDDFNLGALDVDPILTSPSTAAPISPPANVAKQASGGNVILTWDANPESDVAGYKIHYGNFTGYSYTTNTDVGNVTTYTLSGVSIDSSISVTAYDGNIDGTDDQVEGYQSWFSTAIIPPYTGPVWYVSTSGSDDNDGSEDDPFAKIQTAIDSSSNGDTVLVAAGTYTENINYNGKNIVVGSLYMTTSDTSYISSTIIDGGCPEASCGSVGKNTIKLDSNESSFAVLQGFTIQNGRDSDGGGILINSSASLKNLIIKDNRSSGKGAGIRIDGGNSTIDASIIRENTSGSGGGGIALMGGSVVVKNSLIINNNGGGGSAIWGQSTTVTLINCTISNNTNNNNSVYGAIYGRIQFTIDISNTIIWGNSDSQNYQVYFGSSGSDVINLTINNSNVQGSNYYSLPANGIGAINSGMVQGATGSANLNSDPFFVNTSSDDYRLNNYSPMIGTGRTSGAPSTDINGNTRPNPSGTNPDMGAYENALGAPSAPPVPTNLAATAGNGVVDLSWTGNDYATSYSVYRSISSGSGFTAIATGLSPTEFKNTGLTNETTYYYKVSATGAGGESDLTAEIGAKPKPQKYTVTTDGSGDYTVIQTAIYASTDGDTVLVAAGTYTENINYNGKNIVVGSLYL